MSYKQSIYNADIFMHTFLFLYAEPTTEYI